MHASSRRHWARTGWLAGTLVLFFATGGDPTGLDGGVDSVRAQPATGTYVRVATIEESAVAVPAGVWHSPAGIDVAVGGGAGGTDEVFVVDRRLRRVTVQDADGVAVRDFGRGGAPTDLVAPGHIAVDSGRDRVYVADPGASRVAAYTMQGALVAHWDVSGPAGVAVAPDGRVVVTDLSTDRVRVFAPDGSEQLGWGGTGTGPTQMSRPAGIHVAADGTAWVVDAGNMRLVAASVDGAPVRTIRLNQTELVGRTPADVAIAGSNLWLAADDGVYRIELSNGSLRGQLAGANAVAVAVDGSGRVFAAVAPLDGPSGVWRYPATQSSGDPQARWGAPLLVPGLFDGLEGATVGDDGRLWLVDVPPRVQRFTTAGVLEEQIAAPDPVAADADAAGRLLAASNTAVFAYAPGGTQDWVSPIRSTIPNEDPEVSAVAWDAAANRVVVLESGGHRLLFFGAAGEPQGEWRLRTASATNQMWTDLAVAADGTRYALDAGNNEIRGWNAADVLVRELALPERATRFDIGVDGSTTVLFASGWARTYAADGTLRATWDVVRLDLGSASRAVDIAVDAGGRVYVVDGGHDVISVYEWDAEAPVVSPPPPVEAGCELVPTKVAAPEQIAFGETVEISLQLRGACAGSRTSADIALLIDTGMDRSRLQAAKTAAEDFVDLMDPASDLLSVQPGPAAGRLSNNSQFLRRVIRRIEATEGYGLAIALEGAEQELFGRRGRPGVEKAIILLSGSPLDDEITWWERQQIVRAAGQAQRRGAQVFVISLGSDERILYDIATSREHVLQSRGAWQLQELYEQIVSQIKPSALLSRLTITDELPTNMEFVPGSAQPPAMVNGSVLTWLFTEVPLAGTGVRYRVRPTEPGDWPTNVRAVGDFTEPGGATGSVVFPVPRVRVLLPTPTPSATATTSPTPAATRTVTPTPTPQVALAYLPVAQKGACRDQHVDVVLVIDASTSMLELTSGGRPKLDAATSAAGLFLDRLDLGLDQAALVTFNSSATVLQGLTSDRFVLDTALSSVQVGSESRLDLGVALARDELLSERANDVSLGAMIVLTDGRANPVPADVAVAEAAVAKAAGLLVLTIGVGSEVDAAALEEMASRPEYFYSTDDAEALAAVYAAIAAELPCAG